MFPTSIEFIALIGGVMLWWTVIYSAEKDQLDDSNIGVKFWTWFKNWLRKKNDNIALHLLVSFLCLFIGVENVRELMADHLSIPEGIDEVGAAAIIGLMGSFIGGILKKAAKATGQVRSLEELKRELKLK